MNVTLTETSSTFKKGLKMLGIVVIVYYIMLLLIIPVGKKIMASLVPEKDPATPTYGVLPKLEFYQKELKNSTSPVYTLDTADGKLPRNIPSKMTVYKIKQPFPSFAKGKNAQNTAQMLGFTEDDLITSLDQDIYKWKSIYSAGQLEIDTMTEKINLYTSIANFSENYPRGKLTEQNAKNEAVKLLTSINRWYDELYKIGTQKVTLGKFTNNKLSETSNQSEAAIARVDFFRSINNFPIVGIDAKQGLINIYLRIPESIKPYYNYPIMESSIWEIQTQSNATYPIIPLAEAWEHVKNHQGVITSVVPRSSSLLAPYEPVKIDEIYINNIELAYYDSKDLQNFLQPIYVFTGSYNTAGTSGGEVSIYYPAISPQYTQ